MKKRIVYTAGTFDLFHAGHVNLLRQCRIIAGKEGTVVVGVNSDEFVMMYRQVQPLLSFEERCAVVRACRYVDTVRVHEDVVCPQRDHIAANLDIAAGFTDVARFLVIGSDWAKRDYYKQLEISQMWLDLMEITLIYVPYTESISSTLIQQRMVKRLS